MLNKFIDLRDMNNMKVKKLRFILYLLIILIFLISFIKLNPCFLLLSIIFLIEFFLVKNKYIKFIYLLLLIVSLICQYKISNLIRPEVLKCSSAYACKCSTEKEKCNCKYCDEFDDDDKCLKEKNIKCFIDNLKFSNE